MPLTKCPDCGLEVSTSATTCPKCGFPMAEENAKNQASFKKAMGAIATIIAVVMFAHYCSSQDVQSTDTASETTSSSDQSVEQANTVAATPRPIQTYTAKQLYEMFEANEINANQTIGNSIVRFTGVVASIEKSDFSDTPELAIRADCFIADYCNDSQSWNTFDADLTPSEMSEAAKLKIGQTVVLQCDKVSMPSNVYAQDCTIEKPQPATLPQRH